MACIQFHLSRSLKSSFRQSSVPNNFFCFFFNISGIALKPPKLTRLSHSISPRPVKSSFSACSSFITASDASSDEDGTTNINSSSSFFTWDDVIKASQPEYSPPCSSSDDDLSYPLRGFFQRIKACNRGSELRHEFIPFLVDGHVVGYVHHRPFLTSFSFATHLRRFQDVFTFLKENSSSSHVGSKLTLHEMLRTPEDRTYAVGRVIKSLEELIPGIRNELYPVISSFGTPAFFSLERAAAPYFGIKAYGVHMNGYVEKGGQKYLWIAKRSHKKPTYPGMLDHLVAGGLPHDIPCGKNIIKECEEEAGIPRSLSEKAIPVGAVSYMDVDGYKYKRDVLFCYDLQLPEDFVPDNQDGEVDSFKLIPAAHVANIIRRTQYFKSNCCIVITDFLFRHGYISPEDFGYLELLRSLKSGDCS